MFNNIPPITRNIIIINVVVFILTYFMGNQMIGYLAGFYPFSPFFHSWQIITHMFMHGSIMHILFNMMTLFSFGPILEQTLGDKKYLLLYFASGLGAFFLFNAWNFVEVQQLSRELEQLGFNVNAYLSGASVEFAGNTSSVLKQKELLESLKAIVATPMVGASGAIFGVVAAFATLYPDAKIGIMFIPVPMKVKYLLPVIVVISIYLGVSGNGGGIAHLAHVGGALVGWLLALNWKKHLYRFN
ncbi:MULTISPECIES: rhomboid family intramembrane serine protease [Chryseobacterium]|jgi:membrane associated rhomboid family serine protease|uniref:Rhomboid protease glpG n=2 Tax=Chryseobacterium gleum TaxID=250 RepID=A0A3S4MR72_CHRGE|nr:rhomboid family intramembrane serine protease [Chryseobacterium gleum]EFK37409.1 peptidase, S54 family [Chryseobacterium gleum ATCC 35910]QBJ87186.1 rhomboid family intramembrane serine protease [Chryseobacterium gleum]QQY33085.1 rhomboid family intramembrane serine protease [Chryseobacterium gleum]VEE09493.1 Rhomboid protease glpG [Chryseobacterium gleum]